MKQSHPELHPSFFSCLLIVQLAAWQRRAIDANSCLLLLHANQADLCRKKCDEIEASDPERYPEQP